MGGSGCRDFCLMRKEVVVPLRPLLCTAPLPSPTLAPPRELLSIRSPAEGPAAGAEDEDIAAGEDPCIDITQFCCSGIPRGHLLPVNTWFIEYFCIFPSYFECLLSSS